MNVSGLTGAYRGGAVRELKRAVKSGASGTTAKTPPIGRDTVQLGFRDVLSAEKEGYIEVNGVRLSVPAGMASRIRAAYDEAWARSQAAMLRGMAEQNVKAAGRQTKALENEARAMKQAMEIARRIAKGGRVPQEDEQFLMRYSQEMYMSAKMRTLTAKKHEKHDSVLEDEEAPEDGVEAVGKGGETLCAEASVSDGGAVEGVSVGGGSGGSAE